MAYYREDQCSIQVSVDGFPFWPGKTWYSAEGGNLEAADSKTRPGGMGDEFSMGGLASRQDLTCKIQLDDVVMSYHGVLETAISDSAPVLVTLQLLNRQKNTTGVEGKKLQIKGTLKSAFLPDFTTESGDAAFYTIIVACDEVASVKPT